MRFFIIGITVGVLLYILCTLLFSKDNYRGGTGGGGGIGPGGMPPRSIIRPSWGNVGYRGGWGGWGGGPYYGCGGWGGCYRGYCGDCISYDTSVASTLTPTPLPSTPAPTPTKK